MRRNPETIHRRIAALLRTRRCFVVATIIETKGSCPQDPGARMIVHPDGEFEFTIGGGTFEAEVIQDGLAAFAEKNPVCHEYRLTKPDLGMYCQGIARVLFEQYRPRPQLMIFGGGHVGQALSKLAGVSDLFFVTVIDDRKEYAARRKHRKADRVILTDRSFLTDIPETDRDTYIVIVTRCHATDKLLVKRYLEKPASYIGLIGSGAKIKQFRRELASEGVNPALLERLNAPIGLPIGGKDPAEVAISILAEIIQLKNRIAASSKTAAIQLRNLPR